MRASHGTASLFGALAVHSFAWRALLRGAKSQAFRCALIAGVLASVLAAPLGRSAWAQSGPNSDPVYAALRNITLGGEAVSVANFSLKRDAGRFLLRSGTVCFVPPVNGKVTGAVFAGDGVFTLEPPVPAERASLKLLTKQDEFSERFERLVLRFTDSTYDEIKKAGSPASGTCDAGLLKDSQNATRHKIKSNLEIQILEEILSPEPRNLFFAFIHGKNYEDKEIYEIDPNVNSGQVSFWTCSETKWGDWAEFNYSERHPAGSFGNTVHIEHQQLDTAIDKTARFPERPQPPLCPSATGFVSCLFPCSVRFASRALPPMAIPFRSSKKIKTTMLISP